MADVGEVKYKVTADDSGLDQQINDSESKLKAGFGKVAGAVGAAASAAVAAGAAAVVGLTKQAVAAYADYEQLVGGVETLFGAGGQSLEEYAESVGKSVDQARGKYNDLKEAEKLVMENADAAFKTAGLSANDYMETVTGFSAALVASLGGDTVEASKVADQAVRDMSDNANKMGSDMESIQTAYQGFAKQNYTMLDNLKLGYGGTKEEMQRLLADAEKLSGQKFDISSYADIINAIHVVQENMGIAGTTAEEAASTISGSMSMVKASWQNVVAALGSGDESQLTKYIDDLVDSVGTAAGNLIPVVEKALQGIAQLVEKLAPVIAAKLPDMIGKALPGLLQAVAKAIMALAKGLLDTLPKLMPTITSLITQLAKMIISMAPGIVKTGIQLIVQLAMGISKALPDLIPAIIDAILTIVDTLTDPANVGMIIDAAIALILGLADGLISALPVLIERLPEIITNIVQGLIDNLPKLIDGAIQLVVMLVSHLPEIIAALIQAIPQIIVSICEAFGPIVESLGEVFSKAWEGIKDIFANVGSWFKDKFTDAKEKAGEAWGKITDFMRKNREANDKVWSTVGSWFKNKFTEAKNNVVNAWSNIRDKMSQIWERIKSAFRFSDALSWGRDMIQNFIDGIWGMVDRVRDAVGYVADTVKSFLGFSEPEKGPLSNFHTFAPDMMDLFASGMEDNIDVVADSAEDVSRVLAGSFSADVGYNLPDISGYAADLAASINTQTSTQIVVPISIDGREVARATATYVNEQLAWEAR